MQWTILQAKNEENSLELNGILIYSKYKPFESAKKWIENEVNNNVTSYILIGLGLGYHLKVLAEWVSDKPITVYYFENQEYELFKRYNKETWWQQKNIVIKNDLNGIELHDNVQLLVPDVWLKAIGINHPLFSILHTIKINQVSYKKFGPLMKENFEKNITFDVQFDYPKPQSKIACIVSSGPSLDETIHVLHKYQEYFDIYVVGSALKAIKELNIKFKGAVITDAQDSLIKQIELMGCDEVLFYLSTSNYKAVKMHNGKRYLICQKGYLPAEQLGLKLNIPLLETGGSVATATFSLLEYLGYGTIILFGQDLGFSGNETHSSKSTSGRIDKSERIKIRANNEEFINTLPNLYVYLRWFEMKMRETKVKVYNTALKGAKISGVPYITEEELRVLINRSLSL